ncbi:MAG TPA: amidohydrolase family protein [Steroidobacteraceae bacterium]|nr:amidohydrolase family protein [Steroidobacteraceae bacterium]
MTPQAHSATDPGPLLFRNARLLDPRFDEARGGYEILVEGGRFCEVSDRPIKAAKARVIDCGGRTLMPGLIDCHVHVYLSEVNLSMLEHIPVSLLAARAAPLMLGMLDRGFTTVRDTGGADWGIREAVEKRYLPGPRLFISGRAIGPTGGHSDMRRRTDVHSACRCCDGLKFTMAIADGVENVRAAVREELRQGADAIKIMVSGGVASPYDPLDSRQFSLGEIAAAVEEATAFKRYVLAHAYTPEAISRAVSQGVRTIEHGNLIDPPTAKLLAASKGYLVANLVTYVVMKERAAEFGMTRDKLEKNELVLKGGFESLEICRQAGIKVGFGSDLLGQLQEEQSREFLLRREVMSPIEIIRSATLIGAEIVRMEGKLGVIEPGALADLIVVDGDPLKDLGLLQDQGAHLSLIMKEGQLHKNRLQ